MYAKKLAVGILAILAANAAMAATVIEDSAVALPMESGGLFALTAACLAVGIRIVHRKRKWNR